MSARNTAVLIGDLAKYHDERRAGETGIKPCMILASNSDDEVIKHATAGGVWNGMLSKEDDFQGRIITTAYDENDPVMIHRCQKGDLVQLILNAGENAAIGTRLVSNGDGCVQVLAGAEVALFESAEALDLSAGSDTFIKAYVL